MCTVTIVPHDEGVRVLCNRDERRTRPAALPPRLFRLGARVAAFPTDPLGGGTWVGINDAGLVLTLLNAAPTGIGNGDGRTIARPRSRGFVVRAMLEHGSAGSILETLCNLDPALFDPYRLVIVHAPAVTVVSSDGYRLATSEAPLAHPLLFTSSSLGDALVEPARRDLFERIVVRASGRMLDAQARFHRHQWRARPEISVHMERADALTVSRTQVDVTTRGRRLVYEPLTPAAAWQRRRTWCFLP
jgi:hypothetical protein